MDDPLRGTGRTTRMLEAAVDAAKRGELVGISAYSEAYARALCRMAVKMGAPVGRVRPLPHLGDESPNVDHVFADHYRKPTA